MSRSSQVEKESPTEGCPSEPSSLAYCGDNEEEYLRNTWHKLGVGHNGFLSLQELAKVCHAIGMEKVADEVIEQLFSRLDVDGDGQISFGEFVHMFQSGLDGFAGLQNLDDSGSSVPSPIKISSSSSETSTQTFNFSDIGMLLCLDPQGSGYVSVNHLKELWSPLGQSDVSQLFSQLGLRTRRGDLNSVSSQELCATLEEELRTSRDNGRGNSLRMAVVVTLIHELKLLRSHVESSRGERDKYRSDLSESNQRLGLLAQELDEHTSSLEEKAKQQKSEMERQYMDHIRSLQALLAQEREGLREREKDFDELRTALEETRRQVGDEGKWKQRLEQSKVDLRRMEIESQDLREEMSMLQKENNTMHKTIRDLEKIKEKLSDYESLSPMEDYASLVNRVESLSVENQHLRDNNDELLGQVDGLLANAKGRSQEENLSLDGSCVGDYLSSSPCVGGLKRRGEGVWGDGENSSSGGEGGESPRGNKIRRKTKGQTRYKVDQINFMPVEALDESYQDTSLPLQIAHGIDQQSCSLKAEVDRLREMVTQKQLETDNKYRTMLKEAVSQCQDLVDKIRRKRTQNQLDGNAMSTNGSAGGRADSITTIIEEDEPEDDQGLAEKEEKSMKDEDDPMECIENTSDNYTLTSQGDLLKALTEVEETVWGFEKEWNQDKDHLEKQKAALEERYSKMEHNLEILQSELEKNEDYCALRLQEEQDYYDEERKLYDEKFSTLESKIREYEDTVGTSGGSSNNLNSEDSDRLSPIDESAMWEKQVTDLEEETRTLQKQVKELQEENEDLTTNLEEKTSLLNHESVAENHKLHQTIQRLTQTILELEDTKCASGLDYHDLRHILGAEAYQNINTPSDTCQHTSDQSHNSKFSSTSCQSCRIGSESCQNSIKINSESHHNSKLSSASCQNCRIGSESCQNCTRINSESCKIKAKSFINNGNEGEVHKCCNTWPRFDNRNATSANSATNLEYDRKIRQLENSLKMHQRNSTEIINSSRYRHQSEVESMQAMIATTQNMFTATLEKNKEQVLKAARNDVLIKELYMENANLMLALQVTEERQKKAEDTIRAMQQRVGLGSLGSNSDMST